MNYALDRGRGLKAYEASQSAIRNPHITALAAIKRSWLLPLLRLHESRKQ